MYSTPGVLAIVWRSALDPQRWAYLHTETEMAAALALVDAGYGHLEGAPYRTITGEQRSIQVFCGNADILSFWNEIITAVEKRVPRKPFSMELF